MTPDPPRRPRRPAITFALLALSITTYVLLQSLVVPVLSTLQVEFDTDQRTVTWVLTAYLLAASIATPLLGRVGDVVGKTRMLVVCLILLAVGSLLAALAPSIGLLIAARVIQGLGGGVLPLSFGIARDEFGKGLPTALSVLASLAAVGFGIGIVVAGPIVDLFGFRGLFWLPMAATGITALGAWLLIPPSPVRTPSRLPLTPAVLLAGWLVTLLLALSQGGAWGWASGRVLGLLGASVVLALVWVRTELRVPVPIIDMEMMRRRGIWSTNLVAAFVGFATLATFGFLPQLLQTPAVAGYGFDATIAESGWLLAPGAFASFLMGFTTAPLIRAFGARQVIMAGSLVTALSYTSIGLFHDATWQLYAATISQGFGSGVVFASLAGVVVAAVPAEQTGVASGMNANIRTIGGSVGTAVMAGIVTARMGAGGFPVETGYTVGFLMLGGAMLCAVAAAAFIPDQHVQPTSGAWEDADNAEFGYIAGSPGPGRP